MWSCDACTYLNNPNLPKCEQCSSWRSSETSEMCAWSCDACTYLNKPNLPKCEQCSSWRRSDNSEMWSCGACTFLNNPNLPKCEQCSSWRRSDNSGNRSEAQIDRAEIQLKNYHLIDQFKLVTNMEVFRCAICLEFCQPGNGVVLRQCLHMFCGPCLESLIEHSEDPAVACPFSSDDYQCDSTLLEREVRGLVSDEVFEKYLQRSLTRAESQAPNSYHCATPNCNGWCLYEDEVNAFFCVGCLHENCLTCRAIHENVNCAQYQEQLKATQLTDSSLEELLRMGEALKCPTCQIVIMKKGGCDWMMCTMCKTEICWVTRQARWGPKGSGDTTGGCRCKVNGQLCHPSCQNCH